MPANTGLSHPLRDAIERRDASAVRRLLDDGVEVDSADADGRTPLRLAILANDPLLAGLLIEAGADPSARDRKGTTPLHVAARFNRVEILDAMLAAETPAARRAKSLLGMDAGPGPGLFAAVKVLAGKALRRTLRNHIGDTPLHEAAWNADPAGARLLIEAGARPAGANKHLETALHIASRVGWDRTMTVLLAAGADPSARNIAQETPLHLAALGGHPRACGVLLDRGSDPMARNQGNDTVLDIAREPARAFLVSWLEQRALQQSSGGIEPDGDIDGPRCL